MNDICHIDPIEKELTTEELKEVQVIYLTVRGMRCPNCALRVRNGLLSLYGVLEANVDHTVGLAEVVYNPHLCITSALVDAVARSGGDGHHAYSAVLTV